MSRDAIACMSVIVFLGVGAGCSKKEKAAEEAVTPAPVSISVADSALQTPESVLHDRVADVYLVSNINGDPLTKDNNGFIARVSPDGVVLEAKWIAAGVNGVTLDAPKGMAIVGDVLYVSDIDAVRTFNRTTGAPMASWPIAGATFLNDMASGADGAIYVTDSGFKTSPEGWGESGSDALYRVGADGEATAVAKGASLGRPNGISIEATSAIVVTFGSGEVYRIDLASGARTDLPKPPLGQLDGVEVLADGSLLVSSWEASAVYRLDPTGRYTTAVDSIMSPADIGYDVQRGRVLIPSFMQNSIEIREVK